MPSHISWMDFTSHEIRATRFVQQYSSSQFNEGFCATSQLIFQSVPWRLREVKMCRVGGVGEDARPAFGAGGDSAVYLSADAVRRRNALKFGEKLLFSDESIRVANSLRVL